MEVERSENCYTGLNSVVFYQVLTLVPEVAPRRQPLQLPVSVPNAYIQATVKSVEITLYTRYAARVTVYV